MKTGDDIEVIVGLIIERSDGKILLATGKKWGGRWTVTGGHVERGESIMDAGIREGKEETGLDLEPICELGHGEMIDPPAFHRPVHFIYFDLLMRAKEGQDISLANDELEEYGWFDILEAQKLECNHSTQNALKSYQSYLENK